MTKAAKDTTTDPLQQVRYGMEHLDDIAILVPEVVGAMDKDAAIAFMGELYDTVATAQAMLAVAGERVIALCKDQRFDTFQVPGGGLLKFGGGKERTRYDQPRIVAKYAYEISRDVIRERHIVEESVSDRNGSWVDLELVFGDACRTMAEATGAMAPGFNSWRSGVAKKFGINLNDFATKEDTPITVRIEGRAKA